MKGRAHVPVVNFIRGTTLLYRTELLLDHYTKLVMSLDALTRHLSFYGTKCISFFPSESVKHAHSLRFFPGHD